MKYHQKYLTFKQTIFFLSYYHNQLRIWCCFDQSWWKLHLGENKIVIGSFENIMLEWLMFCFYTRTQRDLIRAGYTPMRVKSRRSILVNFFEN